MIRVRFALRCGLCLAGLALALCRPAVAGMPAWLAPGEPLTEAIVTALVEEELPPAGDAFAVQVSEPLLPLANPAGSETRLDLVDLRFDARSERFTAGLLARLESGEQRLLRVSGRAQVLAEVMVPVRPLASGERIGPELLEPALVPQRLLRADTLVAIADLDGTEVRRRLAAGRPVRSSDVQAPRLVRRGEAVELRYSAPGVELATLARALEDGSRGDFIEVANVDSDRRLTARVVGRQLVEIGGFSGGAR